MAEQDEDELPLSDDRIFILKQSRKELQRRVRVEGSDLLDHLIQENVLGDRHVENIKSMVEQEEQVDYIIGVLLQGKNVDFFRFCEALDKTEQGHVREAYLTDKVFSEKSTCVQKVLSDIFLEEYDQLDIFSWHDEDRPRKFDDLWMPIPIIIPGTKPVFLNDYKLIFDQSNFRHILLRGKSMTGKSTFLRKICLDWAIAQTGSANIKIPFDIVLPINLGLVAGTMNLTDMLENIFHLDDLQIQVITRMLKVKPDKVLFLMDGIDDLETKKPIALLRKHPKSKYIIASRIDNVKEKKYIMKFIDTEITLGPLEFDKIQCYIDRFFHDNVDLAQGLKDKIIPKDQQGKPYDGSNIMSWWNTVSNVSVDRPQKRELISLAMYIGYLCIICLMWLERREFCTRRNQLLQFLISVILRSHEKKSEGDICSTTEEILENKKGILMKLGKLASLRNNGKQCNNFTMTDVNKIVGNHGFEYGLLHRTRPTGNLQNEIITFTHGSIKEWLNAFYLTNSGEALKSFISDISENHQWTYETSLIRLVIQINFCLAGSLIVSIMNLYNDNYYIPLPAQKLVEFCMKYSTRCEFKQFAQEVIERNEEVAILKLCGQAIQGNGDRIEMFIKELKQCHTIDFKWCSFSQDDIRYITTALQTCSLGIKELILSYNNLSGCGRCIGTTVASLLSCEKIYLNDCNITDGDIRDMNEIIKDVPHKNQIKVFGLRAACVGEPCTAYENLIANLPSLSELGCPIMQPDEVTSLLDKVSSSNRAKLLSTIDLSFSYLESKHISKMADVFVGLRYLKMMQSNLTDETISEMIKIFEIPHAFGHLESLILCGNKFQDAKLVVKLIRSLPPSVKEIDLGSNHLGNDLKQLSRSKHDYFKSKSLGMIGFADMNTKLFAELRKDLKKVGIQCELEYLEIMKLPRDIFDMTATTDTLSLKEMQSGKFVMLFKNPLQSIYTELDSQNGLITKIAVILN